MKPIANKLKERILKKALLSGCVKTPRGNILIYTLKETRGSLVKNYKYIKLSDGFYTLTKEIRKYWEKMEFKVEEYLN